MKILKNKTMIIIAVFALLSAISIYAVYRFQPFLKIERYSVLKSLFPNNSQVKTNYIFDVKSRFFAAGYAQHGHIYELTTFLPPKILQNERYQETIAYLSDEDHEEFLSSFYGLQKESESAQAYKDDHYNLSLYPNSTVLDEDVFEMNSLSIKSKIFINSENRLYSVSMFETDHALYIFNLQADDSLSKNILSKESDGIQLMREIIRAILEKTL